jgi:hypothetical protein
MALKKSELYSSLWSSCDELRGGMDASQYKDYVLVLLFIKYVSDKYAGVPYAPITIPAGASFKDMVALKGKPDIGDQINKKIIAPLANANKLSDMPVHDRMPVIMAREDYDLWLDPGMTNVKIVSELLKPYFASRMRCYPVSNRVNQVQNDDPECAAPVRLESPPQGRLFG